MKRKSNYEAIWKSKLERWTPGETLTPLIEEKAVSTYQQLTTTITNSHSENVDLTVVIMPGFNTPVIWDITPTQSPRCISALNQPLALVDSATDDDSTYERQWELHYANVTRRNGAAGEVVSGAKSDDVVQAHALRTKASLTADVSNLVAQGRFNAFVLPYKIKPLVSPNGVKAGATAWDRNSPLGSGPYTPNDPPIGCTNYLLQIPTSKDKILQFAKSHGKTVDVSDGTSIRVAFSPDEPVTKQYAVSTNTGNAARTAPQTLASTNNAVNEALAASQAIPNGVGVVSYIPQISAARADTLVFVNDQDGSTTGMNPNGPQRPSFDQQNTFGVPYYLDLNSAVTDKISILQWIGMPPSAKCQLTYEAAMEVAPKLTSQLVPFMRNKVADTPDPDDVFSLVKDIVSAGRGKQS